MPDTIADSRPARGPAVLYQCFSVVMIVLCTDCNRSSDDASPERMLGKVAAPAQAGRSGTLAALFPAPRSVYGQHPDETPLLPPTPGRRRSG